MTRTSTALLFAIAFLPGCYSDPLGSRTTYGGRVVPPQTISQPNTNSPIAMQPTSGPNQAVVLPNAAISNLAYAQGRQMGAAPMQMGMAPTQFGNMPMQNMAVAQGQRYPWMSPSPFPMLASAGGQIDGRPFPYLNRQAKIPGLSGGKAKAIFARSTALAAGIAASPMEDLKYRGGKTIKDLKFMNIYVGGKANWDPSDVQNIDTALAAAMSDPRLNNVIMQYFNNAPVSGTSLKSQFLEGWNPKRVEKADINRQVQGLYQAGAFSGQDLPNTVFNFMLPRGTVLGDPSAGQQKVSNLSKAIPTADEEDSTGGLGGYHGSAHIGNATVYYSIGVYSERLPNGKTNGIPVFNQSWKNVVATFFHELHEARTDADVDDAATGGMTVLGWTSDDGQEIGDYPIAEADTLSKVFQEVPLVNGGTVPIQFVYSNAVHGPEGYIDYPHGQGPTNGNAPPKNPPSNPPNNPPVGNNWPANLPPQLQNWDQFEDYVKKAILKLAQ